MGVEHVVGEFSGLSGSFVFDPEDANACRLELRIAARQNKSLLQFTSWRFRRLGPREHWVAGPLSLGKVTQIAALRLTGPSAEETERHVVATAQSKVPPSWMGQVARRVGALKKDPPDGEVKLGLDLKMVLRSVVESKRAAA